MSRLWYLTSLLPIVAGVLTAVTLFRGMMDDIENMPRLVVPGARALTLEAGDHVVYAETASKVDGVSYVNTSFNVKCTLTAADGTPVMLDTPSGTSSYTLGGYEGRSMFNVTISKPGEHRFACEGGDQPGVLAIGHGIGMAIVLALLAGLGGLIASGLVFLIVFLKRRRQRTGAP